MRRFLGFVPVFMVWMVMGPLSPEIDAGVGDMYEAFSEINGRDASSTPASRLLPACLFLVTISRQP